MATNDIESEKYVFEGRLYRIKDLRPCCTTIGCNNLVRYRKIKCPNCLRVGICSEPGCIIRASFRSLTSQKLYCATHRFSDSKTYSSYGYETAKYCFSIKRS